MMMMDVKTKEETSREEEKEEHEKCYVRNIDIKFSDTYNVHSLSCVRAMCVCALLYGTVWRMNVSSVWHSM